LFTFHERHNEAYQLVPKFWLIKEVDLMTKEELIEENKTLRETLHSIADQIDDILDEAEEGLDEGEE
jgi:hypothetical protein